MAIKSEMVGLKEANKALRALPEYVRDEAQKTMDATAFQFARMAEAAAPRRTGRLALSIRWASRPRSLSAVVQILKDAFYWKFQEFGTVKHGARPFLRPTAVRLRDDHHRRLIQALERAKARMSRDAGPTPSVTPGGRLL